MTSTETPRWTRQPPDVRRRQLLDAAAEVILEKGYDSMAVSEVADRAGVGKGTVYLYFDSKAALLAGLQDRYWASMLEVLADAIEADDLTWTARLERLVDDLVGFGSEHTDLYHSLFGDTAVVGGEPLSEFSELISELLERGTEAGEFDVPAPDITAEFLVSAFHGTAAKLAHASPVTRKRVIPELKTLFRRSVLAD